MKRFIWFATALLAVMPLSSCKKTPPANVAAVVNNHSITYADLDKTYQSQYPQPVEGSSEDQVMTQKLDVLGSLINSELLLQRAEKLGLTAVDADVETEFNKMKAPYTKEEFERQLAARKMTVDDLKSQLRRQLTIDKLINKEITSHITITDADVANFYNPALDQRLRVEHEDNANTMGRLAGQAMAGRRVSYDHLPSFYSDLFELGFEAVGEVDARLETVADWKEPYREGVVYYLRDGRVRGVLLWNVWEQVDAARKLIAEAGPFRAQDLRGRLPA